MAQTIVGLNDAKAVKRYSGMLAVDAARVGYWSKRFFGKGPETSQPIQVLTDLESEAGEQITYDLSMQLKQEPIEGDEEQEGTEEALKFYTDNLYIDQMRGGVDGGGRMTRKRTLHDLRMVGKKRMAEWWAKVFDEIIFVYLSGARGINADFILPLTWAGRANNSLTSPDSDHISFAGLTSGSTKATIANTDKITLTMLDQWSARAEMMGGGTQETPQIQPIKVDGADHLVCLMSPWQAYDLRTNSTSGQWLDIQKAAAAAQGSKNPIFNGTLGIYNDIVLHKHKSVIRFDDYGAGANLAAARALIVGAQAGVMAFGSPGQGLRFGWHEESRDNGNKVVISTNSIWGFKKTTYNSKDFGVGCLDTYSANPNP
jgi:N4-gp56 family major capsid protein